MGSILLKNIAAEGVAKNILIVDNLIDKVVPADVEIVLPEGAEVVDCTGKAVVPGFVNMHTHAGMSMMRGIGEDIAFHEWIDRIWQAEKHIDADYVYHATKIACLEMIKTGTTTFTDHYWFMREGRMAALDLCHL